MRRTVTPKEFDVHGNQYNLLKESKCFLGSSGMTCGTCHDPHTDAIKSLKINSQKCMSCHKENDKDFCPKLKSVGESIRNNCIDCHMPKTGSQAINFQLSGSNDKLSYYLRTHKIAIYNDSADAIRKIVQSYN